MTYKEWLWGLDGTTIIDKLLKIPDEKPKKADVQGGKG